MSELYYAEMEAARNEAELSYFSARPHLGSRHDRERFRAGFERAFSPLWHRLQVATRQGDQMTSLAGTVLTQLNEKCTAEQQEAPPWILLTERLPPWTPGGGDAPVLLWLGPDVLADDCPAHRHVVSNPEYAAKTALKAGYTHWMPLPEGPR